MESLIRFANQQNRFVTAIIILLSAYILSFVCKLVIDFVFSRIKRRVSEDRVHMLAKTRTIRALLKSVVNGFFFFVAVMMILAHFGLNIVPLLTGAGIVGLAFSFGAQTLFKDFIAGFFIIFEDQFNIGDKVKIGNIEGEVHKMTLRMTVLKDAKGNLIFISNSQIESVTRLK
ncbi:hypothetical protein A3B50_00030 [Candidatus Roizmanbacteria bacterium RIFCSPLOWO2_01_FULL_40_42]|uniref:Mechanosensitive ion channel protein MscS n=1 Tax=Candidatus Roizmanbacteria bacterium RIFCSPLOWO2_01_FULL_40_42 TaxID=1802066 RepID=A0A1F7J3G5_9BACT|nr:MAG: hypothetical protein A2779_00935 [Candidatus Roizmanbacteria bacterium RIFCSPHIGHO2_01_FULL_40_98]OGK28931.1 MAG: hypothetical protein A3C31_01575 [Candidatus Roizmanbacteria bacterium RIFCSPHIGHO2_02_FULL_40_53]OGK29603.1 MAG: hypothetical protein A2W49_03965 [Candidatus Roizmanbacteria bacterium RIFCSPHIGHO2_12_41_18]OGK36692.1 MAG: hypothetical protein A3E69_03775 [Candidatus Roizmanbacteria bacterium RIFCSPHIGHO2_12_FULL_40_130]OGK50160.1 MAG: hypothetical protein A3B50_00030 [Candi